MTATLLVSEGDAGAASVVGSIAQSLDLNNRQLHTQEIEALKDYAESLDGVDGKTAAEWLSELTLQAMRSVDRGYNYIDDNPEAQAHLDVLIAQYGETFTNGLGGVMGFLNEDNRKLFRNSLANTDHVIENREFYDGALADWEPKKYKKLQGHLSASDLILLNLPDLDNDSPFLLMPEELTDGLSRQERRVLGTRQLIEIATEAAQIEQRISDIDITGFFNRRAKREANSKATDLQTSTRQIIRDQIKRGRYIGVGKDVLSTAGDILSLARAFVELAVDEAIIGVDNTLIPGDWLTENTGAGVRDEQRNEAIIAAIENIPNIPAEVKQYVVGKLQEYDQAIADARFVEAGEIQGELAVAAISLVTGVGGIARSAAKGGARLVTRGSRVDGPEGRPGGGTGANNVNNSVLLNRQLAAQEIASGHAFEKHVLNQGEFAGLGIRTRAQYADHIENVLNNPSSVRYTRDGRSYHLQESTGTVVVRNPNSTDGGTAFQPQNWNEYVTTLPSRTEPY